jgi:hypothetical protein
MLTAAYTSGNPAPTMAPTPMLNAATTLMGDFFAGFVIGFLDLYGAGPRRSLLGEQFILSPAEHNQAVG